MWHAVYATTGRPARTINDNPSPRAVVPRHAARGRRRAASHDGPDAPGRSGGAADHRGRELDGDHLDHELDDDLAELARLDGADPSAIRRSGRPEKPATFLGLELPDVVRHSDLDGGRGAARAAVAGSEPTESVATEPDPVIELDGIEVMDVSDPTVLALADHPDGPILVVCHERDAAATALARAVLAAHRPDALTAQLSSSHAPLALLAVLLRVRRLGLDAGRAASVCHDLLDATWSAAVLRTVARLEKPAPSTMQHLRSWFPGGRWLVRCGSDGGVLPARAAVSAVASVAGRPVELVYGGTAGVLTSDPTDPVVGQVLREVRKSVDPRSAHVLDPPPGPPRLFGVQDQLQIALLPAESPSSLTRPGPRCRTCGLVAHDPACRFCWSRQPGRSTS
ncbi:MAG: hypothetical protein ACRCZP_21090, partial [Phycicoccus sp.]